ncbi:MAG: hypothetical protein HYU36_03025 [Planctomycetes bacterium]|nr:hypothetical protein [Planctomycetota bacterium]
MRKTWLIHASVLGIALLAGVGLLLFSRRQPARASSGRGAYFFKQPRTCGQCHPEIFNEWVTSRHSLSAPAANPFFEAVRRRVSDESGSQAARDCLSCHAPVAAALEDWDFEERISRWGISCDFCHSVTGMQASLHFPGFMIRSDNIKRGPYGDANPRGHQAEYSELHTRSRFCLECHRDMLAGPAPLGCVSGADTPIHDDSISCQRCHMPAARRKVCTTRGIRERDDVFQHRWGGSRDREMLRQAASLQAEVRDSTLRVTLRSGFLAHPFPAGPPFRLVAVQVHAQDARGQTVWRNWTSDPLLEAPEAACARVLADEGGRPVPFWRAQRTLRDSRLLPGENRTLEIRLPPEARACRIELLYFLAPPSFLEDLDIRDRAFTEPRIVDETELSW